MMEVRGVRISWDTLVIRSALRRSDFTCSVRAFRMPVEMWFSRRAISCSLPLYSSSFTS